MKLFFLLALIVSMVFAEPSTAIAEPRANPSGNCGSSCAWVLDLSTGKLAVRGTTMNNVGWYSYKSKIKTVQLHSGMTSLAEAAFQGCSNLVSVSLGSVRSIPSRTFSGCKSLSSIKFPYSVGSIGEYAFSGCKSLQIINIPDGITSIGDNAFEECSSLETIEVGNGNLHYQSFEGVLYRKNLRTLIMCPMANSISALPDSVENIGYRAFQGCNMIYSLGIPKSVTSIESSAFKGCNNLRFICYNGTKDPGAYSSSVFEDCQQLESVFVSKKYGGNSFCGKEVTKGGSYCAFEESSSSSDTSTSSSVKGSSSSIDPQKSSSVVSRESSASSVVSRADSCAKPTLWLISATVGFVSTVLFSFFL